MFNKKKVISENEIKALRKRLLKNLEQLKFSFWQIFDKDHYEEQKTTIKIFFKLNFYDIYNNFNSFSPKLYLNNVFNDDYSSISNKLNNYNNYKLKNYFSYNNKEIIFLIILID